VRTAPDRVELRRGRAAIGSITGPPERLDVVVEVLGEVVDESVLDVVLPKDRDAFERFVQKRAEHVEALLTEGRELVEEVERLVCAIYGVPSDLTDRIVDHAVARSVRGEL
jgi:hypothetical protein